MVINALINGGSFRNTGICEALDGSSVAWTSWSGIENLQDQTLTGGTWRVVSTDHLAVMLLGEDRPVTINAASIEMSGSGSHFPNIETLAENRGRLEFADGFTFSTAGDFTNVGRLGVGQLSRLGVSGDLLLSPASVVALEIGGDPATEDWGRISSIGELSAAGSLEIHFAKADEFIPRLGQVWKLFSSASASSGSFFKVSLIGAPAGIYASLVAVVDGFELHLTDVPTDVSYDRWVSDAGFPDELSALDFADPDRDGVVNFYEFGLGMNPLVPDVGQLPKGVVKDSGGKRYLGLEFERPEGAEVRAGLTYLVERSGDLGRWSTEGVLLDEVGVLDPVTMRETVRYRSVVPAGSLAKEFLRLKLAKGSYAEWAAEQDFTNLADEDPEADPDGDGASNRLECALGMNPLAIEKERLPSLVSIEQGDGLYHGLHFERPALQPSDVVLVVEGSDDLVSWGTDGVVLHSIGPVDPLTGRESMSFRSTASSSEGGVKFFRLRAVPR